MYLDTPSEATRAASFAAGGRLALEIYRESDPRRILELSAELGDPGSVDRGFAISADAFRRGYRTGCRLILSGTGSPSSSSSGSSSSTDAMLEGLEDGYYGA